MTLLNPWDGTAFTTPSTAVERLGRAATWNVGGVDISDVTVQDFGNYFQLLMPGQAYEEEFYTDPSVWLGSDDGLWDGLAFCTPNDAWKRFVTIEPLSEAPYRIAVGPSLIEISALPELVTIPGTAAYDTFCGSDLYPHDGAGIFMWPDRVPLGAVILPPPVLPAWPSFLLPSTAQYRMFERYAVYDPDDLPTGGTQGTMFCGVGYYGWPAFTAEVDVSMPSQRCAAEFSTYDFMLPAGQYTLPQDNSDIAYVCGAIEAARGLTALTYLQPKPTPVFSAGAPFICGTDHYVIGQALLSV